MSKKKKAEELDRRALYIEKLEEDIALLKEQLVADYADYISKKLQPLSDVKA